MLILENRILIDWLSFTLKTYDIETGLAYDLTDVLELLGMTEYSNRFEEIQGFYGYHKRLYFEGISIHYLSDTSSTILIEMSGSGCRAFETFSNTDFSFLFSFLYKNDFANVTRLDIAYDDFNGVLQKQNFIDCVSSKRYITRFKSISSEISYTSDDWTLYFGSKKSDIMFRIYDKSAERDVKDKIPHWIRLEIQLRDKLATEFLCKVIENDYNIGHIFKGVFHNYIRFCKPTKDKTKQRWKMEDWYIAFLDSAEKISIWTKCDIDYNFQRLHNFVQVNCGNAIDAYIKIAGLEGLDNAIKSRPTKPNPKYLRLVKDLTQT